MAAYIRFSIANLAGRFCSSRSFVTSTRACLKVPCKVQRLLSQPVHVSIPNNSRFLSTSVAQTNHIEHEEISAASHRLDNAITDLDKLARRYSRISLPEALGVVEQARVIGHVTNEQALYLLRTFGHFIPDVNPKTRTQHLLKLWEDLPKLGVTYDINHYNALISNHLDNGHKFSVTEFLSQLKDNGLLANAITYLRLVRRFCEEGDVESANQIISHMKMLGIESESVNASLIHAHFVNNEVDKALAIVNALRQNHKLHKSIYTELTLGYARRGDIQGVMGVLEDGDLPLYIALDAVYVMSVSGQNHLIPRILQHLEAHPFCIDHILCGMKLIAHGHDDVALQLASFMVGKEMFHETHLFRSYIRAMVLNERPVEKISEMVTTLQERGINTDKLEIAVKIAYMNRNPDFAMLVLEQMKKENAEIRPHYFWPALRLYTIAKQRDKFDETVMKMNSYGSSEMDMVGVVKDYVLRGLMDMGDGLDAAVQTITQKYGLNDAQTNIGIFSQLLDARGLKPALEFGKGKKFPIILAAILEGPAVMAEYRKTGDIDSLVQAAVLSMTNFSHDRSMALNSHLLHSLCGVEKRPEKISQLISAMKDQGLKIREADIGSIQQEMNDSGLALSPNDIQMLNEMSDDGRPPDRHSRTDLLNHSLEEVEGMLARNPRNKTYMKWLLEGYCVNGNTSRADEICQNLERMGFIYPDSLLGKLAYMEGVYRQDIVKAKEYIHKLQVMYPSYSHYVRPVLNIALLHLKKGHMQGEIHPSRMPVINAATYAQGMSNARKLFDIAMGKPLDGQDFSIFHEAVETIGAYRDAHTHILLRSKDRLSTTQRNIEMDCRKLIQTAYSQTSAQQTLELVQLLWNSGFVQKDNTELFDEFIRVATLQGKPSKMVTCLDWVIGLTGHVPRDIQHFLNTIIKDGDSHSLQLAVDMLSELAGSTPVLNQLIICFIQSGHTEKAMKIVQENAFRSSVDLHPPGSRMAMKAKASMRSSQGSVKTPDLDAMNSLILSAADSFVRARLDQELSDLVTVTKDLIGLDRGRLLGMLAQLYVSQKKYDKAAEVLLMFRDAGVKPPQKLLQDVCKNGEGLPVLLQERLANITTESETSDILDNVVSLCGQGRIIRALNLIDRSSRSLERVINQLLSRLSSRRVAEVI